VASDLIIDNLKFYSLGETFRVLKKKEEKQYGEYRTRRLVLKYVSEGGIRAIDVI